LGRLNSLDFIEVEFFFSLGRREGDDRSCGDGLEVVLL